MYSWLKKEVNDVGFQQAKKVGTTKAFYLNGETPQVHGRENGAISMAVDGPNVYLTWTNMEEDNIEGYYVYSNDGAQTFSTPINVGAIFYPDSTHHTLMPCIAADAGNMVITWQAINKETLESEYVAAYSSDAGATLQQNLFNIF